MRLRNWLTVLACASAGWALGAETSYAPGDSSWGANLTVAAGDVVTIAGSADSPSVWSGAVTVNAGGTLKTTGRVTVTGATTVNAAAGEQPNGVLDVVSGALTPNFSGQKMLGDLIVRAGAQYNVNATDSISYNSSKSTVTVYGTLNCGSLRVSVGFYPKFVFHDGSKVIGPGDGNAGIDIFETTNRVVICGDVTIATPFKQRDANEVTYFACYENAHLKLLNGIGTGAGNLEVVAATAAEGNPSGVLGNNKVEFVDQGTATAGTVKLRGEVKYTPAKATNTSLVFADNATVTVEATEARLQQLHTFALAMPAMTGSIDGAVALTGDGVVTLPANFALPINFAGGALAMNATTPIALATGSSVTAPSRLVVNELPAGAATTLLTGADVANFDATQFTVSPAHLNVALGTPSAAAIGEGALVANNVAAYDANAWIEPYIVRTALIWLDAADGSNFLWKDGVLGTVQTWLDKTLYQRHAQAYTIPSHSANWGTYGIVAGVPAYRMGATNSGIDLMYTRMTTIRTVFWAMAILKDDVKNFWLGDTANYNFHRGVGGPYAYGSGGNDSSSFWCDGTAVANPKSDIPPTDRHVYSSVRSGNHCSDRLTCDRNCVNYERHAGRDLSELICLDVVLADADRQAIENKLKAKWMGTNPTAARTAVQIVATDDFPVEDPITGTMPIEFAEGSSITVTHPSSTEPMIKTTGALTVSGSAVAVNINAAQLTDGTYTVLEGGAGSNLGALSQYVANLTPPVGGTASLAIEGGKLVLKVSTTGGTTTNLTWRPTATSELVWATDIVAWLNGDERTAFVPAANVTFDGEEEQSGAVVVNAEQQLGAMRVTGATDYTFTGTGKLDGLKPMVLEGTGTVTLDGPALGEQDIEVKSGKLVLGSNAGANSLGSGTAGGGGTLKIDNGAQFNFNYTGTVANNTDPRALITNKKTVQIAGEGPDGRGALVNDSLDGRTVHNEPWNSAFSRIELTDDATIGGADRFDVRVHASANAAETPSPLGIYGPGKTLTVKNTGYFGLVQQPIDVQAVRITDGGIWRPEAIPEANIKIPGGITLDNGTIHTYSITYPNTVPLNVTENGGIVDTQNATSYFKGPLAIAENAKMTVQGGATVFFQGAITNRGLVEVKGGNAYFTGAVDGNFAINANGGNTYLGFNAKAGLDLTLTSGMANLDTGFEKDEVNPTFAGGFLQLYNKPKFKTLNLNGTYFSIKTDTLVGPTFEEANVVSTGSSFDVLPQAAGEANVTGVINMKKTGGTMYVYGPNNTAEHDMAMTLKGSIATTYIGLNSKRKGGLRLKEGSDVTMGTVRLGTGGQSPSAGKLVIDPGAKLTISGSLWNGEWSVAPDIVQKHIVDVGGTLLASNNVTYLAYDSIRSEMFLREGGFMALKGLQNKNAANYGNGVGEAEGWHRFRMEGGRFDMGPTGFQDDQRVPGVSLFDLANGYLYNYEAWGTSNGGLLNFGETMVGGHLTFDLGTSLVNWNTGLAGSSALTLKGAANFQGNRKNDRMQGAMLGKVTIENTGNNDLRTAGVLGGGLELAAGTHAEVGSWGDEKYAYTVGGTGNMAGICETAWSYPYAAANFFGFMHNNHGDANPYTTYTGFGGRGEFYVPADKVGKWTFAGCYDDYLFFYVDGVQVVMTGTGNTKCNAGYKAIDLTEGWHSFTFWVADADGACRPTSGWQDRGMALGFRIGESTSTAAADYTKFAPGASLGGDATLQIRPYVNACIWSWQNGKDNWNTTENWAHVKPVRSVNLLHMRSTVASDKENYESYFLNKASRFDGWFKVEDDQAGEWTFKMVYDDNKQLNIDGERVISTTTSWNVVSTGTKTLTPGWHRWEARVQDYGGGWGPNNVNNNNTLSYIAPGAAEKQWNETNLKLAATLGDIAVLEKTGIYKELVVGEEATLTSSGSQAMPIFGKLKGNGTLAGLFAFKGGHNSWVVEGLATKRDLTSVAKFTDVEAATFAELAKVEATFDARPLVSSYALATAPSGLTAEDVKDVATVVKDTAGNDYSENFFVTVKNGKLVLANKRPGGFAFFIR